MVYQLPGNGTPCRKFSPGTLGMGAGATATVRTACAAASGADIATYTAFNEPDKIGATVGFIPGADPGPQPYLDALVGLSVGVKSQQKLASSVEFRQNESDVSRVLRMSRSSDRLGAEALITACKRVWPTAAGQLPRMAPSPLRVNPGGFMQARPDDAYSLAGLAPLLGPLYSNSTLDAIDIHTEFDVQYAPIEGQESLASRVWARYNGVLKATGIPSLPVPLMTTEFGAKTRIIDSTQAAKDELTTIVDVVTVTNNHSGATTPVTIQAFPWNVFHTDAADPEFSMAVSQVPYAPNAKGRA
jgi:hypothetical protein